MKEIIADGLVGISALFALGALVLVTVRERNGWPFVQRPRYNLYAIYNAARKSGKASISLPASTDKPEARPLSPHRPHDPSAVIAAAMKSGEAVSSAPSSPHQPEARP